MKLQAEAERVCCASARARVFSPCLVNPQDLHSSRRRVLQGQQHSSTKPPTMSKTIQIASSKQFQDLLTSSHIVVTDCELSFLPSKSPHQLTHALLRLCRAASRSIGTYADLKKSTQIGVALARLLPLFTNNSLHNSRARIISLLRKSMWIHKRRLRPSTMLLRM